MELGVMIYLEDANIDQAVFGVIRGVYLNAGQVCMGVKRVIVHKNS